MTIVELSADARTAVEEATQYARRNRHTQVDGPHLLWAIIKFTGQGQDWEQSAGSGAPLIENLEGALKQWYALGAEETELSPTYILIMRKAQAVAAESTKAQITPGHLLKAVLETDDMLKDWLETQGIESGSASVSTPTPMLDELGRDLTQLARNNELPQVIGRADEVRQLIEVILRHGKNSAMLLGEAGVGKTAVVERLAQDIVKGTVPSKLKHVRLVELNFASLVAGTSYRGQFEERLQQLLDEVERSKNIIIVIDEFHTLMGAGSTRDNSSGAADILKPALARGRLTCVGITTQNEYARYVEKDQAFARRFERITVLEPGEEETRAILDGVVTRYEGHHSVRVDHAALDTTIRLASQYMTGRQFPDKAIDILGRACSRAEIDGLEEVTPQLISTIVTEMTGVPVGDVSSDSRSMLNDLENYLVRTVVGQREAITVVAKAVRLAYTGLRDPKRPKGIFLFVGPSGVGKTQLARSLAAALFNDEKAIIRLDMSEYGDRYTVSRLIGAPPGYIGHDEPGQLTQPLRERPYSVVLLDEVEKAHPEVFDIFLQLFDEGRLSDAQGRPVDGRHAIFIMTSNLVTMQTTKKLLGFDSSPHSASPATDPSIDALRSFFRPEFLNRIDHIIHFRELELDDLVDIAQMELQQLQNRMDERSIKLTFERDVADIIAQKALRSEAGARSIKRVVEQHIAVPVSEMLLVPTSQRRNWLHIQAQRGEIALEWI